MQPPARRGRCIKFGLAPPGVMADWGNYAYYFCLNGYYDAGLRERGGAQRHRVEAREAISSRNRNITGRHSARVSRDAGTHARLSAARWHVVAGVSVTGRCSRTDQRLFPRRRRQPQVVFDIELGAHHLIPQGVLEAKSLDARSMMNHMEDVQFLADGWFDFPSGRARKIPFTFGGFAKVQPYYCRNAEIYAMADDVKPFIRSYFNTLPTLLNTEVLSLQEHFNCAGAGTRRTKPGTSFSRHASCSSWNMAIRSGSRRW